MKSATWPKLRKKALITTLFVKTRANVCKRIAVKDFGFVIIFAIVLFIFFLFKSNPNLNLNNIQNSLIFSLFYLLFHFSFFPCAFFTHPPPRPEIRTVGLYKCMWNNILCLIIQLNIDKKKFLFILYISFMDVKSLLY